MAELLRVSALAFALAATAPSVLAEPASADPAFRSAATNRSAGAEVAAFTVAGAGMTVSARGRRALNDTGLSVAAAEESRAMSKVMPGYPQPAQLTLDVKLWF